MKDYLQHGIGIRRQLYTSQTWMDRSRRIRKKEGEKDQIISELVKLLRGRTFSLLFSFLTRLQGRLRAAI